MTNHNDPSDRSKPVRLRRLRLDDAGVREHFNTVGRDGQEIEIRVKGAAAANSDESSTQLRDAVDRLIAGEIFAVQVQFFQDGDWWSDTVMRRGDDFRLVRMKQSDSTGE